MTALASLDYTVNLNPQQGTFTVIPHDGLLPPLEAAGLKVIIRQLGSKRQLLTDGWKVVDERSFEEPDTPHGILRGITLHLRPTEGGLRVTLTFAVLPEKPLLLWKVSLINLGQDPAYVERIEMLHTEAVGWLDSPEPAFYCNGWQSWGFSGAYGIDQGIRRSRLAFIQSPLVVNAGTPQHNRPGAYSSDFYAVLGDRQQRRGLLLGVLSERQHFASIEALYHRPSLRLWANGDQARLDPGQRMETDWAVLYAFQLDRPDPLGPYLEGVAHENAIHMPDDIQAPAGWCSWYHFYQNLSATKVEDNLRALLQARDRLPLSLVQIDDGFERQVGDWFEFSRGFPHGVAGLAKKISQAELTPGLWLAPFIVHPQAKLMRKHPDWILRGKMNQPVNAGFVWDQFTTALDLTHPEALDYACQVVKTAVQENGDAGSGWGFPYLKLDFLYAGALPGKHRDPTRTRAQVLRAGLEALRQSVGPQVFLLGCGAPLGPSLGLFDAMRIGADVSGDWLPKHFGIKAFFRNEPHMPSARNSIQNILTRANMHRRWWINDPDCLLLRPETDLSLEEVRSLASVISLTGGSLLVSDDLPRLPAERMRIAEVLLPVLSGRADVIDWLDTTTPQRIRLDMEGVLGKWHLLGYFNWSDRPLTAQLKLEDFRLSSEPGEFWARSFWKGETWRWTAEKPLLIKDIPVHGGVVLAVRAAEDGNSPQYLGSDLHISQGREVVGWQVDDRQVRLSLDLPRKASGEVEVLLPDPPIQARIGNEICSWRALGERRYAFNLSFDRKAELVIDF